MSASAPSTAPFRPFVPLLLVALGACAMTDRSSVRDPDTVTILYNGGDERLFGPEWDDSPKFLIFQPLATYYGSSCGEPEPSLAESWEHTPDRRVWTVRLRPDVRWHDGVPVTAEDVEFNLRLWRHPDVAWYGGAGVDSVEVVDAHTLRVHARPPGDWPLGGWDVFYPKHLLDTIPPKDFFRTSFWTRPIGNGPYRYVRHVPETMIELEANPDYYRGKPAIERVVLQFKAGGGSPLVELRAGTVDMVVGVEPLEAAALAGDARYRVYWFWQGGSFWTLWNHNDPRLRDARVRRAFAHAVDRRLLHRSLGLPEEQPLTDAPYVSCQLQRSELTEPWPYEPSEASRLLDEAGWRDADGDGVREWHGASGPGLPTPRAPLRFTLTVAQRLERHAIFLRDQLMRVGADMEIQLLDASLVRQRLVDGEFEAILPLHPRPQRTYPKGETGAGVPDVELARLLSDAEKEFDPERQIELHLRLGERYREVAPGLFLGLRLGTLIADRRIQGLGQPGTLLPRASWRWPFGGLEDLSLEEEP